jgi:hypothetical protein
MSLLVGLEAMARVRLISGFAEVFQTVLRWFSIITMIGAWFSAM